MSLSPERILGLAASVRRVVERDGRSSQQESGVVEGLLRLVRRPAAAFVDERGVAVSSAPKLPVSQRCVLAAERN